MTKCLGCGITLQTTSELELGYTPNLEKEVCERCFKLQNYGTYTSVALDNNDYLKIINSINKNNLIKLSRSSSL